MELKFNGQYVFRTGQRLVLGTKPKTKQQQKEDNTMNANASIPLINTLARGINAIAKWDEDQLKQLAALQPDPPPACILAPTESQKEIDDWYAKQGTIKTNVNGVQGMESYAPPPLLLADPKEEK